MTEEQKVIQVTTKDPKKVEAGKRLAEYNRKKREELKNQPKSQQPLDEKPKIEKNYAIGGLIALGLVGGFAYFIYKKQSVSSKVESSKKQIQSSLKQPNKFEME